MYKNMSQCKELADMSNAEEAAEVKKARAKKAKSQNLKKGGKAKGEDRGKVKK